MSAKPEVGANSWIDRFSTAALPERDRVAIWREEFGRKIAHYDFEALGDAFHADMTLRAAPELSVISASHAALRVTRTNELLADGDDSIVFHVSTSCGLTSQSGKEVAIDSGEAIFVSNADVGIYTFPEVQSKCSVIKLSRSRFGASVTNLNAALMRKIPSDHPALQLFVKYVAAWLEMPTVTPELDGAVVTHIYDLAGLTIGANRDTTEMAMQRGVRAARVQAAKAFVLEHLASNELSVAAVAKHLGVTPRYIHMLFESEHETFSEFVLARRLDRALGQLSDSGMSGVAISKISLDSGFGDLSYFNRTFRRRYGTTPREVRADKRR